MNRTLTVLLLVLAFSLQAMAQSGKGGAQTQGTTTTKKPTETKTLSIAELHEVARRVSVLLAERTDEAPSGTRHIGSGVWLAEGIVATCWHVVSGVKGPIKISLGTGGVVTYGEMTMAGVFMDYAATVVASDPAADIAILKTEQNPFTATGSIIKTPTQEVKPRLSVARVNEDIPVAGSLTVLSGYPLSGYDLVSQTGNVAGTGAPLEMAASGMKAIRILVSVVSNGGNSGGPVLNDHGELIGLLEGNFLTPIVVPQTHAQIFGFLPKTDSAGNPIKDDKGNFQITGFAPLTQNSGISLVIPSHLLTPFLKQAQETK